MGDQFSSGRHDDGVKWIPNALCWTIFGMLGYLFTVGCIAAVEESGGYVNALQSGIVFALFGGCIGVFVWIPLWLAAVVSGALALFATRRCLFERDGLRRLVFAFATAVGSGLFMFGELLWFSDHFHGKWFVDLAGYTVPPVFLIAGFAAWCYYPRQSGSSPGMTPRPVRARAVQEFFAEPPAPPSIPDGVRP